MGYQLKGTVYVTDPDTHQTVALEPGTLPEPRLAALVTNPAAWVDGKMPRLRTQTKPETETGKDPEDPNGPSGEDPDDASGDGSGPDSDDADPSDDLDDKPATRTTAKKATARKTAAPQ